MVDNSFLGVPSGIDEYSGLFICPNLRPHQVGRINAFCIPVNIEVVSGPPPIHIRLVSYQMRYWSDGQPLLPREYENAKLYQSSKNGQTSFSFTIQPTLQSVENILALICRHFCGTEVLGKASRDKESGLKRFMQMNTATVTKEGETYQHIHHIQSINRDPVFKTVHETLLATVDGETRTLSTPFTSNRSLVNQVKASM